MSGPNPARWTDQLWRSALTLLAATVAVYIAWKLLAASWPFLLIAVGLLLVIRIAIGAVRGWSDW